MHFYDIYMYYKNVQLYFLLAQNVLFRNKQVISMVQFGFMNFEAFSIRMMLDSSTCHD